jgi:hypothetical protein
LASETDTDLKRLAERKAKEYQPRARTSHGTDKSTDSQPYHHKSAPLPASTPTPVRFAVDTREKTPAAESVRQSTPLPPIMCFNCRKPGHVARDCTEPPRQLELKDIEEIEEGSGNESA